MLGQLYERVEQLHEAIFPIREVRIDNDLVVSGYEIFLNKAQNIYESYAAEFSGLLLSFGIETEVFYFILFFIIIYNYYLK